MPLEDIYKIKLKKLENIRQAGINPYPAQTKRTHQIGELILNFEKIKANAEEVIICGRLISKREHGGSLFADLEDASGRIQIYFKKDIVGGEKYKFFLDNFDIGDFIEIKGEVFLTKREEKTVEVSEYAILAKSLLPLPEKWHGLKDVEERFRKRYLDLIMNKGVKAKFETRSKIIKFLRNFLDRENFMEVETPILQIIPGGALAQPFKTHLNALDLDLYLRIAPELYLKRLLVGGFERVYEIGRCFRNEGMDAFHNPDFTMLEFYAAYSDYNWLIDFVERMMKNLLEEIFSRQEFEYEGNVIDFKNKWEKIEFGELIKNNLGIDYYSASREDLLKKAHQLKVMMKEPEKLGKGKIADEIYKKICRPKIVQPTFLINHPIEISPLAKSMENDKKKVERFQLIVGGLEIVNAFSELNDPVDQRERFKEQEKESLRGDVETQRTDEDFLEAMEYGMPPAAGAGIGIDRLTLLLTNSHSVREVILFPIMKPK